MLDLPLAHSDDIASGANEAAPSTGSAIYVSHGLQAMFCIAHSACSSGVPVVNVLQGTGCLLTAELMEIAV